MMYCSSGVLNLFTLIIGNTCSVIHKIGKWCVFMSMRGYLGLQQERTFYN